MPNDRLGALQDSEPPRLCSICGTRGLREKFHRTGGRAGIRECWHDETCPITQRDQERTRRIVAERLLERAARDLNDWMTVADNDDTIDPHETPHIISDIEAFLPPRKDTNHER